MKVLAFVGPSGTGKSYRALWIAKQKNVEFIIDDGLLIHDNRVIAGISAKKEPTKLAATRRACFFEEDHIADVKGALGKHKPSAILILATSENMANIIRKALGLEEIEEVIRIEDVATKEEMEIAHNSRNKEGKHVIPVPTFELKKTFSGYFMDRLNIFKKKDSMHFSAEKTVIRPTFSYLGRYVISDTVIKDIAKYVVSKIDEVSKLVSIDIQNYEGNVSLSIGIVVDYKKLDKELFPRIQEAVKHEVERLTCMNVLEVNVLLKSLEVKIRG